VGGGVVILLAVLAALISYLCARQGKRRGGSGKGNSAYLPLYDEEVRALSSSFHFLCPKACAVCSDVKKA
jgi:hypothetical protein